MDQQIPNSVASAATPTDSHLELPGDTTASRRWEVQLWDWVIQDGNQPNLAVGDRTSFAVLMTAVTPMAVEVRQRRATLVDSARYAIEAEVIYVDDDLVLLDFGILAYMPRATAQTLASNPVHLRAGEYVAGQVTLAVDPYMYREVYAQRTGVPPAVFDWTIVKVGKWQRLRPSKALPYTGFVTVDATDAWADDGTYLLTCELASSAHQQ